MELDLMWLWMCQWSLGRELMELITIAEVGQRLGHKLICIIYVWHWGNQTSPGNGENVSRKEFRVPHEHPGYDIAVGNIRKFSRTETETFFLEASSEIFWRWRSPRKLIFLALQSGMRIQSSHPAASNSLTSALILRVGIRNTGNPDDSCGGS